MSSAYATPDPQVTIHGVKTELRRKGGGRPLLFLTALEGWIRDDRYFDLLAEHFDVLCPSLPGFNLSELPANVRRTDDLALFVLSLLDELDLKDALLVGSSFGGWVAAETAIRSTSRLSGLVLVDALGVKHGRPQDRDIADIYVMTQAEVAQRFYHDPAKNRRDVTALPDHVLTSIARSRETLAFFGWEPYMHNPSLKSWLDRIDVPALVLWGADDRFVATDYGRAYADAVPGSRFVIIPEAGHYPHIEQPDRFVAEILAFEKSLAQPVVRAA